MSVRTVIRDLKSDEDASVSVPLQLVATIPTDEANTKIPISISVSYLNGGATGAQRAGTAKLQSYHYAVPNRRASHKKDNVADMPLLDTNNDWVRDLTRKIAVSVAKRHGKPCYVAWASNTELNGNGLSMDQLFMLKSCISAIDSMMPSPTN
ncbi:Poc4p KNAG_0A03020 [Huiozyma naganishii CBS 8797]|uniref:Proteasome assembly chaperone 3 n=1 Tax=Huiozyma naganishii (strain ATCC MYA-139 / BCRC 22969 / CBS 8797 / KCTC 17520 / NBRC 10181 / NCYC 3082 / Yp74L-3) TaxID=1071383 RepID=J7QZS7_HUIN7|nr:hypothetical protein KNAG_0A03020 [Kazachstania naganishii CBS 8797]CCK67990.1 hypothetical protein KNAG_0A03020 [Kazachstania naganishii CBS 8797]